MNMTIYYRISYNGIGIYEALKKEMWNKSDNPKKEWEKFKNSDAVTWLKKTDRNSENNLSYFTELGYNFFMENIYPTVIKYFNIDDVLIEKFDFDEKKLNIMYYDEHQIVIKLGSD